ncbi:MAG: DUF1847 domain-containing protein [Gemmatimonadota bacterium]
MAPRCTIADSVLLITLKRHRILGQSTVRLDHATWMDLARLLAEEDVDTLVCGGISRANRESILSHDVDVIDNVAGTTQEVVEALRRGGLRSGFGLGARNPGVAEIDGRDAGQGADEGEPGLVVDSPAQAMATIDCLACADRRCLRGAACPLVGVREPAVEPPEPMLEAAWDVACENERMLCRLAELVYFAMEMGYAKLGVAFCADLLEPATVLVGVLRRFFDVLPVCCKVGAAPAEESRSTPCNPAGQAAVMNQAGTDLNVLVGLCVGADAVFARESRAPVTTIFVKDKSLANNPIGAVYSHYHLQEI